MNARTKDILKMVPTVAAGVFLIGSTVAIILAARRPYCECQEPKIVPVLSPLEEVRQARKLKQDMAVADEYDTAMTDLREGKSAIVLLPDTAQRFRNDGFVVEPNFRWPEHAWTVTVPEEAK